MATQTFSWYPDASSQQSCKPAVQVTKFGDGYETRVAVGINTMPMKWSLSFDRAQAVGKAILDFLRARGGVEVFYWTNPMGEAGKYVCREWKTEHPPGGIRVTCDFEQVFEA